MSAGATHILASMADPQLEEDLTRRYGNRYDIAIDDAGKVTLTPTLTAEARRARLGGRPLTDEEFESTFGDLPTGRV